MNSSFSLLLLAGVSLVCLPGAPTVPEVCVDVQFTTFYVPAADFPLSLLEHNVTGDEALFRRLVDMVTDGTAKLIADHHCSGSAGQEISLDALKEVPYPTEYDPLPGGADLLPKSSERKNCETRATAIFRITQPHPADFQTVGLIGTLWAERIRGDELASWPVSLPQSKTMGSLSLPKFRTEITVLPFRIRNTQHHLLSMTRPGPDDAEATGCYLTFFRGMPRLPEKCRLDSAAHNPPLQVSVLSFRQKTAQAMVLLRQRHQLGEAAVLKNLLAAVRKGTASITHQSLLLIEPSLVTTPPVKTDPFGTDSMDTSGGDGGFTKVTAAHVDNHLEFAFPTEFSDDLLPQSFEFRNIGNTVEARVITSGEGPEIQLSSVHSGLPTLHQWPDGTDTNQPVVHQPSIPSTRLQTRLKVQPGGVYCLGAVTLPRGFEDEKATEPEMEIFYLKLGGHAATGVSVQPAIRPEVESQLVSLTAETAQRLSAQFRSPEDAAAFVEEELNSGSAHTLAYGLLPGTESPDQRVEAMVEWPGPESARWTSSKALLPGTWMFYNGATGLDFGAGRGTDPKPLQFSHCFDVPVRPTLVEMTAAADGDGKLGEPERFDSEQTIPSFSGNRWLSIPSAIPVPARHPEAGRWEVLMVRRTE